MWGSDWPVVLLADGYTEWFDLAVRLTGFNAEGRAKLFGGNAAAFYGLEDD
jgi:L-fuconolactonase